MSLTDFSFMVETVSENSVNVPGGVMNFEMRFYNLFLLYFWFEIIKFLITWIPKCFRRLRSFNKE